MPGSSVGHIATKVRAERARMFPVTETREDVVRLALSHTAICDGPFEFFSAMPYPDARAIAAGRWLPSFARIWSFETNV